MVGVDKELSSKIANMSFICALFVVLIHCPKVSSEIGGGVALIHNYLPGAFTPIVNAFFFIVSGFFLAAHIMKRGWWKRELSKRIDSLIIPYLFLNGVLFVTLVVYQWPNVRYPNTATAFYWVDILRPFGLYGTENPINGPLWFVRSLMLFVISLPVYEFLICRKNVAYALCLLLLLFNCFGLWDLILPDVFLRIYRPQWLVFFFAGIVLRLYGIPEISRVAGCWLVFTGFVVSCVLKSGVIEDAFWVEAINWVNMICLIQGFFSVVSTGRWPGVFTRNSFAIYVLHWPLIDASYIIFGKTGVYDRVFGSVVLSVLYLFAVVMVTIITGELVRRNEILSRLVLGGR